MQDNKNLIPDEDFEYEKELARKRRLEEEDAEKAREIEEKERIKAERDKERAREQQLAKERVELMKMKSGVIEHSDSISETPDTTREVKGFEKVTNFLYHYKILVIFVLGLMAAAAYIIYDAVTRKKPDMTVVMIANNGLEFRTEELADFFEKYIDDRNGDGEVYVQVISCPLNPNSTDMTQTSNQAKALAQLQTAENLFMIVDSNTDPDFLDVLYHEFPNDYPDNKYMTENGLSLNFKFFANEIKFESMPYDVVLGMRAPIKTVQDSKEDMQSNFERDLKVFEKIADDLKTKAEETGDTGLETPPAKMKKNDDSSSDSSK
ncbi:MAG: hypothetical protein K6F91_07370 [Ruminococcus sp.]|nr:hypothetical protein [Ruminococcus sp.]